MDDSAVILLGVVVIAIIILVGILIYMRRIPQTNSGNAVLDLISAYQNWKDVTDPTKVYAFQLSGDGTILISYYSTTGYIAGITQLRTSYSFPNTSTLAMTTIAVISNPTKVSQPQNWQLQYVNDQQLVLKVDGQGKVLRLV